MKPYYEDNHIQLFNKDCRDMSELPDECVQVVCTSPPYWGLRKYSGEQELIWGDNHCEHQWTDYKYSKLKAGFCSLCGAWKGAFGLEPTPEMYVQHTIEILREIRRVLRKDGVVFWNIGDSYQGGNRGASVESDIKRGDQGGSFQPHNRGAKGIVSPSRLSHPLIKPKDLCLIPQRLMIVAQEDGWWVRSLIIWSKRNTMPESVNGWRWERHKVKVGNRGRAQARMERHFQNHSGNKVMPDVIWEDCPGCKKCLPNDGYILRKGSWRPTESHEYILMLSKTGTYYCDAEAVRELSTERPSGNKERKYRRDYGGPEAHTGCQGFSIPYEPNGTGRNLRSVWTFATMPFPSFKIDGRKVAHFAVFPEKLPELCIKAATPEVGCCSKCGAPWARVVKHHRPDDYDPSLVDEKQHGGTGGFSHNRPLSKIFKDTLDSSRNNRLAAQPTCACQADKVPSLVLDPLMGSGTTLLVAKKLNRQSVGYELSQDYCQLAMERCRQQVLV